MTWSKRMSSGAGRAALTLVGTLLATQPAPVAANEKGPLWTHPDATQMDGLPMGPFVTTADGALLTSDKVHALRSTDGGQTWTKHAMFADPGAFNAANEMLLLTTRSGAVVFVFSNLAERHWKWIDAAHDATPESRVPAYVIRSTDHGRTWSEPVMLHDDWTGANRTILQTATGDIVFTSMLMLHDPGRHATVTYVSDDDGVTWQRSNVIDLGGRGHHDGAMEATIVELRDGRLWMLIRTNEDRFWQAFSEDGGRTWPVLMPSDIDASAAPAQLARLQSGRIAMAWNRLYPEGQTSYPRLWNEELGPTYMGSKDPSQWSRSNPINHREELALSFSDDDGVTWSTPVILARQQNAWLSYPFIHERAPGELWITTMQGDVRLHLKEADFLREGVAAFHVEPSRYVDVSRTVTPVTKAVP